MIVVDTSVVVELLLNSPAGVSISKWLWQQNTVLHVPHLTDLEVTQTLRRYVLRGAMSTDRADLAIRRYSAMPLIKHEHESLLMRVWSLRHNVTAYDAVYLALAEALNTTLVTRDHALSSIPGLRAPVLVC